MDNHLRQAIRQIVLTEGDCLSYEDYKLITEATQKVLLKRGCYLNISEFNSDRDEDHTIMVRSGLTIEMAFFEVCQNDYENLEPGVEVDLIYRQYNSDTQRWSLIDPNTIVEVKKQYYVRSQRKSVQQTIVRPTFSLSYGTETVNMLPEPGLTLNDVAMRFAAQFGIDVNLINSLAFRDDNTFLFVPTSHIPEAGQAFIAQLA